MPARWLTPVTTTTRPASGGRESGVLLTPLILLLAGRSVAACDSRGLGRIGGGRSGGEKGGWRVVLIPRPAPPRDETVDPDVLAERAAPPRAPLGTRGAQ